MKEFSDAQPNLVCNQIRTMISLHFEHVLGSVSGENITFAYPSRPDRNILEDVSFQVGEGEIMI